MHSGDCKKRSPGAHVSIQAILDSRVSRHSHMAAKSEDAYAESNALGLSRANH
jgi:hypothetical protein